MPGPAKPAPPVRPVAPANPAPAAKPHPLPAPAEPRLNKHAIPALLCSFFGITAPVGVYLGRKARKEIGQTGETGDPYAVAALIIGWAYLTALVLGIATYLIFAVGGS